MGRQFEFFDRIDIDGDLRRRHALLLQLRPAGDLDVDRDLYFPFLDTGQVDIGLDIRRPDIDDRIARPRQADIDRLGHVGRNILRIEVLYGDRHGITALTEGILFVDDDEPQDDSQEKADDFELPFFINLVHKLRPPFKNIGQALRRPVQERFQDIAQGIAVEMTINMAAIGIRNGTRFFTDDDDDGIGQFTDADGRPVTRP